MIIQETNRPLLNSEATLVTFGNLKPFQQKVNDPPTFQEKLVSSPLFWKNFLSFNKCETEK